MIFTKTPLAGSYVIDLEPVTDSRGWFARTWCKEEFENIGHNKEWVQLNHSFTTKKGALRGMHYQLPPFSEIKMVRCIAGAVYDVIIDLRSGSDSFLQWFGTELSAKNKKMMYIPAGFAHGFQTLTEDCELLYHHSELYTPGSESGILYNDAMVGIDWPLLPTELSVRDQKHQPLTAGFKGIKTA
ncbi:MAG: dTDP-4-dehydrorhamnose 3,5-epimerase [Chitinophagaceae bacterium]